MTRVVVPGRANLIGEHTDYNEGLALPFALDLAVTIDVEPATDPWVAVEAQGFGQWRSDETPTQEWSRQAAVAVEDCSARSRRLSVTSTLPVGAGLSSSAAYVGALALAFDVPGDLLDVARTVQRIESRAGHDVGLLDQLATLGAREGAALLIDFATLEYRDVALPRSLAFSAVHSGVERSLAHTAYGNRRRECDAARQQLGPWREATLDDVGRLDDATLRRRARHVLSENDRVRDVVDALGRDDPLAVGAAISTSHASLRDDFEVSTPAIDRLVEDLCAQRGVYGARLVGGGFGGCVLVVHEPGAELSIGPRSSWELRPSPGAFARLGRARELNSSP